MGLISIPNESDATLADANDLNSRFAIVTGLVNGNIDNANIASGGVSTANLATGAVTTAKIADGAVTNAKLATSTGEVGAVGQPYTPTWTASSSNPTLNNGTLTGSYTRVGQMVTANISLIFGSTTTTGTGAYQWSLPVAPKAATVFVGSGWALRVGSAFEPWPVSNIDVFGATQAYVGLINAGGGVTSTTRAWANGDKFVLQITYEAA